MSALDCTVQLSALLETWSNDTPTGDELVSLLGKIAGVLESAVEAYLKCDPDPLDTRHPSSVHPDCPLGHILKKIFKAENFITALFTEYLLLSSDTTLNTVACRLVLDMVPGLKYVALRETEGLIEQFFKWAEQAPVPLSAYAVGVLASLIENHQDIASNFKEQNSYLAPIMLERLETLSLEFFKETDGSPNTEMEFSSASKKCISSSDKIGAEESCISNCPHSSIASSKIESRDCFKSQISLFCYAYQVFPLTQEGEQHYILLYLASIGEYQEFISFIFKDPEKVLRLLIKYINIKKHGSVRLAFTALKFIAVLVSHKKCALEFLSKIGIQHILQVPQVPSVAAVGVSLVFYYLACNEDTLQRICVLPEEAIKEIMGYVLWLLVSSHNSGRVHATVFIALTVQFNIIRKLFDRMDGLRILLNVISTSRVITSNSLQNGSVHAQNQMSSTRMLCRHVFVALKKYFEAHAESKALELRQLQHFTCETHSKTHTKSSLEDNVKTIASLMPPFFEWEPVEELLKLDGIIFLLKVIAIHGTWQYSGRTEAIRNALDVLYVCSVSDRVKLTFCKDITYTGHNQEEITRAGTFILLQVAAGYAFTDIEVRQAALNVIVMSVCGSDSEYKMTSNSRSTGIKRKRQNNDVLSTMWNSVRSNDGIMILCRLLRIKDAVPDADSIRALACEALCGLARCEKVMQILRKLPFISNGQLQSLMREPVLKEKQLEHAKFVKYCTKLIEMAAGTSVKSQISNIEKAEIVAQTTITYNDRQLLHLIVQHLESNGYHESASLLQAEAKLKSKPTTQLQQETMDVSQEQSESNILSGSSLSAIKLPLKSECDASTSYSTPGPSRLSFSVAPKCEEIPATPDSHLRKDHISRGKRTYSASKSQRPQKHFSSNPELSAICCPLRGKVTLDSIVSEYLRNQHAHCKTPCLTPPSFDLFTEHRCPEPRNRNEAPTNITLQILTKQFSPSYWGYHGAKMNMKFLSRRFRNVWVFHDVPGDLHTSCAFWSSTNKIIFGTNAGNIKIADIYTDDSVFYHCHNSEISSVKPLKNTNLFLTSGSWKHPGCSLWDAGNNFNCLYTFNDECYAEFSKQTNSHIISTKYERARIYDVETGNLLMNLVQPNLGNSYRYNRATFNYKDDLVLSDGVIWDVRSESPIHKLDKFNTTVNGVFHPNCVEIISNSQVWDLRSYTLLRNVPELEQCKILFDHTGSVIFAAIPCVEARGDDAYFKRYGTSFRTFDADNYSCIGMKDVQRGILDIALDDKGKFLAVIQNRGLGFHTENSCNLYAIGRSVEDDDDSDEMNSEDNDDEEEEEDEDYVTEVRDSQLSDNDNEEGGLQGNEAMRDDENVIERLEDSTSSDSDDSNSIENDYYFSFRT